MSRRAEVVVVGAGISGLTTAFWLHRSGVDVTVLEREKWVGGTMRTLRTDGWLVEMGPNSALETTPLFSEMFDALGPWMPQFKKRRGAGRTKTKKP